MKDALLSVEKILKADRRPLLAEEVHHKYENKYELAHIMSNLAIVAQMNALELLGLTPEIIRQVGDTKTTTLRFEQVNLVNFHKEETVDVEDANSTESVSKLSTSIGSSIFSFNSSSIHKVIKKVKEYHWIVNTRLEIAVFSGTEVDKGIVLQNRDASIVVITQFPPLDLNLTCC